jgi:hypothetical protein
MKDQIYFTSSRFQIDLSEEEMTNPGCFGKELANWLCQEMKSMGYTEAEVIPEDFGWCVMCSRKDFMLWIGCSSILPQDQRPITLDDIRWSAFSVAEIPFYDLKAKFLKMTGQINPKESQEVLQRQLKELLEKQTDIAIIEEP